MTDVLDDAELLQAFRLIDEKVAEAADPKPLLSLRDRLAAELVGDADRVADALSDTFELTMYASGAVSTIPRDAIVHSIRRQRESGGLMWLSLSDLVADSEAIAAYGALQLLVPTDADELSLTSTPFAMFLRFRGHLMTSEVLYMDSAGAVTTVLSGTSMPSVDHLRDVVRR